MDGRDWGTFLLPYEQAVEELKVKFKTMRAELKNGKNMPRLNSLLAVSKKSPAFWKNQDV